jgi:hypothetical protein
MRFALVTRDLPRSSGADVAIEGHEPADDRGIVLSVPVIEQASLPLLDQRFHQRTDERIAGIHGQCCGEQARGGTDSTVEVMEARQGLIRHYRAAAFNPNRAPGRLQKTACRLHRLAASQNLGEPRAILPSELRSIPEQLVFRRHVRFAEPAQVIHGRDLIAESGLDRSVPSDHRCANRLGILEVVSQILAEPREHRIVDFHSGDSGIEQRESRVGAEPGRGPVGGTPEADSTIGTLTPRQNRDRGFDLPLRISLQQLEARLLLGAIQRDDRLRRAGYLFAAAVGVDAERPLDALDHCEWGGAQVQFQARA